MMLDKASYMGTLQGQGKVPLTHLNAQDALMVTYLTKAVVKKKRRKLLSFRSKPNLHSTQLSSTGDESKHGDILYLSLWQEAVPGRSY